MFKLPSLEASCGDLGCYRSCLNEDLLTIVANLTKASSVISTYAAKGSFKRGLKANGFQIKKYPGPPGKREMMVGFKNFENE